MVVLRPTRKLWTLLPVSDGNPISDTALGDWYANRLFVDRKPLLLLSSSASLLTLVIPARHVREIPEHLSDLVANRLAKLGVANELRDAERRAMASISIAPTASRSVLASMNDFARAIRYQLPYGEWDESWLEVVEDTLAETPCLVGKSGAQVIFSKEKAPELLMEKWAAATVRRG